MATTYANSTIRARANEAFKLLGCLETRPKVGDWGTKVLFVYETLWEALDYNGLVADANVDTLLRLLGDPEIRVLARNVIPELRDTEDAANLTAQSKISFIARVQTTLTTAAPDSDSAAVDSAMYEAEKNAVYDADAYRTMLFLRRTERFDEEEMGAIRDWLEKCPVKLAGDKGGDGQ